MTNDAKLCQQREVSTETPCGGTAPIIRDAHISDLPLLLEIYNYEVEHGAATLDLFPKSLAAWELWFDSHQTTQHPLVVAEVDGVPVGYACLGAFRHKDAYRPTVELSIYVDRAWRRHGIAGRLMEEILRRAQENPDIHLVVSVITGKNEPSEKLHKKFGFTHVGNIEEVAYKSGQYHTICLYTKLVDKAT